MAGSAWLRCPDFAPMVAGLIGLIHIQNLADWQSYFGLIHTQNLVTDHECCKIAMFAPGGVLVCRAGSFRVSSFGLYLASSQCGFGQKHGTCPYWGCIIMSRICSRILRSTNKKYAGQGSDVLPKQQYIRGRAAMSCLKKYLFWCLFPHKKNSGRQCLVGRLPVHDFLGAFTSSYIIWCKLLEKKKHTSQGPMEVSKQRTEIDWTEDHCASVDVNVIWANQNWSICKKSHWRNTTVGFEEFQVLTRETLTSGLESISGAHVVHSPTSSTYSFHR